GRRAAGPRRTGAARPTRSRPAVCSPDPVTMLTSRTRAPRSRRMRRPARTPRSPPPGTYSTTTLWPASPTTRRPSRSSSWAPASSPPGCSVTGATRTADGPPPRSRPATSRSVLCGGAGAVAGLCGGLTGGLRGGPRPIRRGCRLGGPGGRCGRVGGDDLGGDGPRLGRCGLLLPEHGPAVVGELPDRVLDVTQRTVAAGLLR